MSEDNAALTATIKAGTGYDAPWLVVRANNPDEMTQRLNAVINGTLTGPLVAAAQVLQAEWSGNSPAQQPAQTFQAGAQQPQGFVQPSQHAQAVNNVQNAVQGAVQPGGNIEVHPKGWGTFEHNHPQAPQTMYGPKVLKRAKSQAGNDYAQWLEPRDPAIPSVYAANGKAKPQDYIEPEFAKGV